MSNTQALIADPMSQGCFCLPAIDAGIPVDLDQGLKRREILSRFATASVAAGVRLPAGQFKTIEQVVQAQWQQFTNAGFPAGSFRKLAGAPVVEITDEILEVTITSKSTLCAFQLKPVVEALERSESGLGWFVESVVSSASCYGHELYCMGHVTYMLESQFWNLDEYTDDAFARAMLMEEGNDPPKGSIPAETLERLRGDYSYWPSDILAEVEGHAHLLSWGQRPKGMSKPEQAKRWLSQHPRHRHAKTVDLAVQMHEKFRRADREFIWNGHDDDTETIGALAFITWSDPQLLFEAVSHHEECQYQGGQAIEAFARCQVKLDSETIDADLRRMAKATANYMTRWALLEKLLSQFPTWEGEDDV